MMGICGVQPLVFGGIVVWSLNDGIFREIIGAPFSLHKQIYKPRVT